MHEFIIFTVCCIGSGIMSYRIGREEGAANTVDLLEDLGIINVDEDGEITPNKLYVPKYQVKK